MKNNSIFSNKIVLILLSAILAFGLWIYVITVVSPNSETTIYDIPVSFEGDSVLEKSNNLIITAKQTTKIDLRVAGNRSDLNKLNSSNIKVKVDVTKIYDPSTHDLNYTVILPGDIPTNAVSIQTKSPATVRVVVEQREEKEIPVIVNYSGTTPDNYVKELPQLDRETIMVAGPVSALAEVTQAVVEVDLTDRKETISETKTVVLCNEAGEKVENELITPLDNNYEVTVTVPIALFKEVKLNLTVLDGGGATRENVQLSHESIFVSGPAAVVSALDAIELGVLDLSKIKDSDPVEFEVKLPEGVTNESGVTTVTVEIKLDGLATKSLQVTKIQCINTPQGMTAEASAEQVEVIVRGTPEQLARLNPEDITVIIDLTEGVVGTDKYTAVIQIADSFSAVGAIGVYAVTITIRATA